MRNIPVWLSPCGMLRTWSPGCIIEQILCVLGERDWLWVGAEEREKNPGIYRRATRRQQGTGAGDQTLSAQRSAFDVRSTVSLSVNNVTRVTRLGH
jgi:hypothetical protein